MLLGHSIEFLLDASGGFTSPTTCVGKEIEYDALTRVPAVVVID